MMKGRKRSLAAKIAGKLMLWAVGITVVVGLVSYYYTLSGIKQQYAENFHMRMLINYEYTRRVLSDVYVQVSNHVYYIEQQLDKPELHLATMQRIVQNGNRVHSCGMVMLVAVAFVYMKYGIKLRYEINKLECERPEGV